MAGALSHLEAYYGSRAVRERIAEYCGGRYADPASCTALGLAGFGGRRWLAHADGAPVAAPLADLARLLDEGADVCRSLADRQGTLLHLDIDYVHLEAPTEPYDDPAAVFEMLEPVYQATRGAFLSFGVEAAVLMTGRGYHFTARVRRGTRLHRALLRLGGLTPALEQRYREWGAGPSPEIMGRAHEGAGRLLTHLVHEVLRRLRGHTRVPLTLAELPPARGGPFVCLDLTAYADPLFARQLRCAFSANQKPRMRGLITDPFVMNVPRLAGEDLARTLEARRDPRVAAERAGAGPATLPDTNASALTWLRHYESSRLARFHREFDTGPQLEPAIWPFTYDRLDLGSLPACAQRPLEEPNPALLTPVFLRTVALALWGLGWHPRSIAALVRSRFEKQHAWGDLWQRYDPGMRADFYVRLFCGAVADELDDATQFDCESQRGRGACLQEGCGFELRRLFPSPAAENGP